MSVYCLSVSSMSFLMISMNSSILLVGVWGVLDSGSLPLYTAAKARLKGVGVRGASPLCRDEVGDSLDVLGVEWAEAACGSSELRVGVVSSEPWPVVILCSALTGVLWAVGG